MKKLLYCLLLLILIIVTTNDIMLAQSPSFDWRSDWAVAEGFTIVEDTTGYHFPSAIAFVPQPGPDPKDPLYFVTELRGTIKVVTNDRTILTFAESVFRFNPTEELPSGRGQGGMGGICLDPEYGYIFVTFLYTDASGRLRNNIVRYQTTPGTFGVTPASSVAFTEVFAGYESGLAHHIGPCQVVGDQLFVGIGEAWQPHLARDPDQMVGKIYRMSLDGQPLPDNPFYIDNDIKKAQNYVWATGFRNPYAMRIVDGRVFVADNGVGTDRFIEVERGEDYGWNGQESSIHLRAAYVWVPSLGPTTLQYLSPDSSLLGTAYAGKFFLGMAGSVRRGKMPGIVRIDYNMEQRRVSSVPEYFLRFRGKQEQMVVAVAFGPDGLYFAPLYENQAGQTSIYKIVPDATNSYPYRPLQVEDPRQILRERGCLGCHQINGDGGFGGAAGPPLSRELLIANIQARLNNAQYRQLLADLDKLEEEPWVSTRPARAAVLNAEGEAAIRQWIINQIVEPRWDNRGSQMPNLGVSPAEAAIIADYLLAKPADRGWLTQVMTLLRSRLAWASFGIGIVVGVIGLMAVNWVWGRRKKPRL
jgi:glucose/arabinose dehydrogenase